MCLSGGAWSCIALSLVPKNLRLMYSISGQFGTREVRETLT